MNKGTIFFYNYKIKKKESKNRFLFIFDTLPFQGIQRNSTHKTSLLKVIIMII